MDLNREKLHEEVWSKPMTAVGDEYGISVNCIVRACQLMNIPRPKAGHWQKLAHGKPSPVIPLPQAHITEQYKEFNAKASAVKAGSPPASAAAKPKPKPKTEAPPSIGGTSLPPRQHRLVSGTTESFLKGHVLDNGFVKPSKRILPDIVVSAASLSIALTTAGKIYVALEKAGHRVTVENVPGSYADREIDLREPPGKKPEHMYPSLWKPSKPTVVKVNGVFIGLVLFEMTHATEVRYVDGQYIPLNELPDARRNRSGSWTTTKNLPTKKLALLAYSAYNFGDWSMQWRESTVKELRSRTDEVITALEDAVPAIADIRTKREQNDANERRRWEEQWEQSRRAHAEQERIKQREKSLAELLELIKHWEEAKTIRAFFDEVESLSRDMKNFSDELQNRLTAAKALILQRSSVDLLLEWDPYYDQEPDDC